jgi:hypothetical protein
MEDCKYEQLKTVFNRSKCICNPIEFEYRQQQLLEALAAYVLERDKPEEETQE